MKNGKNNSGLIALIVILLLLVFGLGGYIVYDKVFSNNLNNYTQGKNNTQSYNYNLTKRTTNQAVRNGYIEILVDTDGSVYLYTIGNDIDDEADSQIKTNLKNLEKKFKTYTPREYMYIDGSNELKAYKLDIQNVLTSYYVHKGNGGFSYFVFLKENGKLSYLCYDKLINNGEIDLKDIENLENVVSVVENTYSMIPYVVTSNGNELSLYDYIK